MQVKALSGSSPDLTRLLEETRWLAGLARRLVIDPGIADDLVQDTLISALQAENQPGPEETRGWLATILRRKAIGHHRSTKRRDYRERETAREEALPGPDELAALLESEGLLRDALAELDEPYRRTVLLRYREGLSAAEIARRDGEPAGTVRWRLKSGLEQLRVELEKREKNWATLFLPLSKLPGAGTAAVAGLGMGSKTALAAVAALLLSAVGAGVWWLNWDEPKISRPQAEAAELDAFSVSDFGAPGDAEAPLDLDGRLSERTSAAPAAAPVAASEAKRPADRGAAQVELRAVDVDGNPVPGAVARPIDMEHFDLASSPSGRDGRLVAERDLYAAARFPAEYAIEADGFGTAIVELVFLPGVLGLHGDVVVGPGGAIHGFATDVRGLPHEAYLAFVGGLTDSEVRSMRGGISGDDLSVFSEDWELLSVPTGCDPGNGEFWMAGVPALHSGHLVAFSRVDDTGEFMVGLSDPILLQPGETFEAGVVEFVAGQRLEAEPQGELAVHVRVPEGLSPQRFELKAWRTAGRSSTSLAVVRQPSGSEFRVPLPSGGVVNLRLRDEQGVYSPCALDGLDGTQASVELVPERTESVVLQVFSPAGDPLDEAVFEWNDGRDDIAPVTFERLGEGRFRWTPPGDSYGLRIVAAGAAADLGRFKGSHYTGPLEVRLTSSALPVGRVLRDGAPVEGATVDLVRLYDDAEGWITGEVFTWVDPVERAARGTTGPEGGFELPPVPEGRYAIGVSLDRKAEYGGVWLPGEELVIDLGLGGRLEGRVTNGLSEVEPGIITTWNGHGLRRSVPFGRDGGFEFSGLPPGRWFVKRSSYPFETSWIGGADSSGLDTSYSMWQPAGGIDPAGVQSVEIVDGTTTSVTVEVEPNLKLLVQGHVRIDGARPAGGEAWLQRTGGFDGPLGGQLPITWHRDGRLRGDVPGPGVWSLQLVVSSGATSLSYTLSIEIDEEGLVRPIDLDLETGDIVLNFSEPATGVLVGMDGFTTPAGLLYGSCWYGGQERARIELPHILAGPIRILRPDAGEDGSNLQIVRTAELMPGEPLELTLP